MLTGSPPAGVRILGADTHEPCRPAVNLWMSATPGQALPEAGGTEHAPTKASSALDPSGIRRPMGEWFKGRHHFFGVLSCRHCPHILDGQAGSCERAGSRRGRLGMRLQVHGRKAILPGKRTAIQEDKCINQRTIQTCEMTAVRITRRGRPQKSPCTGSALT